MLRPALLLAATALAIAPVARASVVEALSLDALVRASEHVVHARAVRVVGRFEGTAIVTTVTLEVVEAAKGRARPGTSLEVVHLGGVVGDLAMRVEGAPHFDVGAECVLFAGMSGGRLTPVGMSQGVLPVRLEDGQRRVHPGGAGLALVRRRDGRLGAASGALTSPRPLADVLAEVRGLVGAP